MAHPLRRLRDRQHAGVGQAAFDGDGVVVGGDFAGAADHRQAAVGGEFLLDDGGHREGAGAGAGEGGHQGGVVEFADDAGAQAFAFEPGFQAAADGGVFAGQQQRQGVEAVGEGRQVVGEQGRSGEEAEAGFEQAVVVGAHAVRGRDGGVGDDEVELVHGKLAEQAVELPFAADDAGRLFAADGRLQQLAGQRLGDGIGDADAEFRGPALGVVLDHHFQLGAQGEEFVGVVEGELAGFGEGQRAPLLGEELGAEALFEQADLAAQGLRRDGDGFGGAGDAAGLGHFPEIEEVLVVHRASIFSMN